MVLLFGMPNLGEMIILVVLILLLFGGKKLPELARGLGAGIHEFKRGMNQGTEPTEAQPHQAERDVTPAEHQAPARARQIAAPRRSRPAAKKKSAAKKKK